MINYYHRFDFITPREFGLLVDSISLLFAIVIAAGNHIGFSIFLQWLKGTVTTTIVSL